MQVPAPPLLVCVKTSFQTCSALVAFTLLQMQPQLRFQFETYPRQYLSTSLRPEIFEAMATEKRRGCFLRELGPIIFWSATKLLT